MKKLISILVAFAMMAMLAVTAAFAADPHPGVPADASAEEIAVTKNLQVANDIDSFAGNVVITFAPGTAETYSGTATVPTPTKTFPITLGAKDVENEGKTTDASTCYSYTTGSITPEELGFTGDEPAGVYHYTVTEAMTITAPVDAEGVDVKPVNDANTSFTLNVLKTADNEYYFTAADKDGKKKAIVPGDTVANGLQFTNQLYSVLSGEGYENAKFKMTKDVDDQIGVYDGEEFNFDFSIVLPAGSTIEEVSAKIHKTGVAADANFDTWTYTAATNTITGSVTLADDEQLYFESIPSGAYVSANENDNRVGEGKLYIVDATNSTPVSNKTLDADGLEAKIVNKTNEDATLEGILHNSIPYIVLALVAIGGMVAYVVVRRRNADEA